MRGSNPRLWRIITRSAFKYRINFYKHHALPTELIDPQFPFRKSRLYYHAPSARANRPWPLRGQIYYQPSLTLWS